ncbi:hypothetical protein [Mycobacterium intracellulare]|uniref:hypothetical protein n=1 Tax=Mycobacterium intracellulare TaxID=1767 RepID=UPI001915CC91|nr:hypothetical protein [Mycobacterium intracellulare]BCO71432.1 hypothetical protein MINTM008_07670 [Mycobacterium intracellulare]BCO76983.1 hypothetical protein MINTM009_07650 [Mycobacterium intracellulare]BCP40673.1 hypothetical protein MINTMi27_07660 [Mycobacterium intracellulare]
MPDAETGPEAPQDNELDPNEVDAPDGDSDGAEGDTEPDAFDRPYVEKIRKESAGYRDRAKTAEARVDELSRALFAAHVAATGKLENPAEIEYNADIVDDADAINEAIDAAIAQRPYIKARRTVGNVGQGIKGDSTAEFSLLDRLKGNA